MSFRTFFVSLLVLAVLSLPAVVSYAQESGGDGGGNESSGGSADTDKPECSERPFSTEEEKLKVKQEDPECYEIRIKDESSPSDSQDLQDTGDSRDQSSTEESQDASSDSAGEQSRGGQSQDSVSQSGDGNEQSGQETPQEGENKQDYYKEGAAAQAEYNCSQAEECSNDDNTAGAGDRTGQFAGLPQETADEFQEDRTGQFASLPPETLEEGGLSPSTQALLDERESAQSVVDKFNEEQATLREGSLFDKAKAVWKEQFPPEDVVEAKEFLSKSYDQQLTDISNKEFEKLVALNNANPNTPVPATYVDENGETKEIILPGNAMVDNSGTTLGQQFAAHQALNPGQEFKVSNLDGYAQKIDDNNNITGIRIERPDGSVEISGQSSFATLANDIKADPDSFPLGTQIQLIRPEAGLRPGEVAIPVDVKNLPSNVPSANSVPDLGPVQNIDSVPLAGVPYENAPSPVQVADNSKSTGDRPANLGNVSTEVGNIVADAQTPSPSPTTQIGDVSTQIGDALRRVVNPSTGSAPGGIPGTGPSGSSQPSGSVPSSQPSANQFTQGTNGNNKGGATPNSQPTNAGSIVATAAGVVGSVLGELFGIGSASAGEWNGNLKTTTGTALPKPQGKVKRTSRGNTIPQYTQDQVPALLGKDISTAITVFNDRQGAYGPLNHNEVFFSSPFLPEGTVLEVTANGKTIQGPVKDFGPDLVFTEPKNGPQKYVDASVGACQQLGACAGGKLNLLTQGTFKVVKTPDGKKAADVKKTTTVTALDPAPKTPDSQPPKKTEPPKRPDPKSGNDALDEFIKKHPGFRLTTPDGKKVKGSEAAKMNQADLNKLEVSNADGKSQGTFEQYRKAEEQRAQQAVNNAARAQQLNQKFGPGHQVTGSGQVTRNNKPAGQIAQISAKNNRIAQVAQKNNIKPVFRNGKVYDQNGRELQLKRTGKVDPAQDALIRAARSDGGRPQIPGAGKTTYHHPLANKTPDRYKYLVLHQAHTPSRSSAKWTYKDQANGRKHGLGTPWWYIKGEGPVLTRPEENWTAHIGIYPPTAPGNFNKKCSKSVCKNRNSIGIEIDGMVGQSTNEKDMQQILETVRFLQERYNIKPENVLCHCKDGKGRYRGKKEAGEIWRRVQAMNYQPGSGSAQYQLTASEDGTETAIGAPVSSTELTSQPSTENVTVYVDSNGTVTPLEAINPGTVSVIPTEVDGKLALDYQYTPPKPDTPPDTRITSTPDQRSPITKGWERLKDFFGGGNSGGSNSPGGSSSGGGSPKTPPPSRPANGEPNGQTSPTESNATGTATHLACEPDPAFVIQDTVKIRVAWNCENATSSVGLGTEDGMSADLYTGGALVGMTDKIIDLKRSTSTPEKLELGLACQNTDGKQAKKTCTIDLIEPTLAFAATPKQVPFGHRTNLRWAAFDLSADEEDHVCAVFGPKATLLETGGQSGEVQTLPLTTASEFVLMCDTDSDPIFRSIEVSIEDQESSTSTPVNLPNTKTDPVSFSIFPTSVLLVDPDEVCHPDMGTERYAECVDNN